MEVLWKLWTSGMESLLFSCLLQLLRTGTSFLFCEHESNDWQQPHGGGDYLNKGSSEESCEQCPWNTTDSQPQPAAAGGLGLGLCGHLEIDGREAREAEEVYSEHSQLTGALV